MKRLFKDIPAPALWVGAIGLLPFIIPVIGLAGGGLYYSQAFWAYTQIYYAAVILSFLGGIHWGWAMHHVESDTLPLRLVISVFPALFAWVCLLLLNRYVIPALMLGFLLAFLQDEYAHRRKWCPAWYLKLRLVLTTVVVICLAATGALFP